MPLFRLVTNKAGQEGIAIGLQPKDMKMLRQHGMCQNDIRTFALAGTKGNILLSVLLVWGNSDEEILNVIDPARNSYVLQESRITATTPKPVEKKE